MNLDNYSSPNDELEPVDVVLRNKCRAFTPDDYAAIKPIWTTIPQDCQFPVDVVTDDRCYMICDICALIPQIINISDLQFNPSFNGAWWEDERYARTLERWMTGQGVDPPRLSYTGGKWTIDDGRHRAVLAHYLKPESIIVCVKKSSIDEVANSFNGRLLSVASDPHYLKYEFILSLPSKTWNAVTDYPCDDKISVSQLLHEYTHYIQDVATLYGHISRNNAYCGDLRNERETIGASGLSILSIKENMAANAQRYLHDDRCQAIPHDALYEDATDYAESILKGISKHPLFLYAIESVALSTNQPVVAFEYILTHLSAVNNIQAMIGSDQVDNNVYAIIDEAHAAIDSTDLKLDMTISVEDIQVSGQLRFINQTYGKLLLGDGSLLANHPAHGHISDYIHTNCINSLKQTLQSKYKLIELLIDFKKSQDFNVYYSAFGAPFMRCDDGNGVVRTNIDQLVRLSNFTARVCAHKA